MSVFDNLTDDQKQKIQSAYAILHKAAQNFQKIKPAERNTTHIDKIHKIITSFLDAFPPEAEKPSNFTSQSIMIVVVNCDDKKPEHNLTIELTKSIPELKGIITEPENSVGDDTLTQETNCTPSKQVAGIFCGLSFLFAGVIVATNQDAFSGGSPNSAAPDIGYTLVALGAALTLTNAFFLRNKIASFFCCADKGSREAERLLLGV